MYPQLRVSKKYFAKGIYIFDRDSQRACKIHLKFFKNSDRLRKQLKISYTHLYLKDNNFIKDDHDYKWWVPITFDYADGHMNETSPSHWLTPDKVEIEIENLEKNKAVIVNIQQTGYYR